MRKLLYALLFSALFLSACGQAEEIVTDGAGTQPNSFDQLRNVRYDQAEPLEVFLVEIGKYYQLPGVAAAFVQHGMVREQSVVGTNKAVHGTALSLDSKFQIASCNKSFTSLLVGTFVQEGGLSWDTRIGDIFPQWKNQMLPHYRTVTMRQLLSHTAGIMPFSSDEDYFSVFDVVPGLEGTLPEQRRRFALWNFRQTPANGIGEFNYSNGGYVIVAAMLEQLTGRSYEALVAERIFERLGLASAEFGYAFLNDESQPWRHYERDDTGFGMPLDEDARPLAELFNPAGSMSMSISDFARYVSSYLQAGEDGEVLISNEIRDELFAPVVARAENDSYALGWAIRTVNGTVVATHSGSDQTVFAMMSIDLSSSSAVVAVTNIGGQRSEFALINIVLELLHSNENSSTD